MLTVPGYCEAVSLPRVLQLVHGYPDREVAGTELYTQRLATRLAERGWPVDVVAATRAPGRPHGSVLEEALPWGGRLIRVVNNLPWRPLDAGERDPLIDAALRRLLRDLAPDVVHVQHLLFLSAHLHFRVPTVATLHDAWGWCARGGTLLRDGQAPCPGPTVDDCARCYGGWAKGGVREHQLAALAGQVAKVIPADTLHRLWKRVPGSVRALSRSGPAPQSTSTDVETRQHAVRSAFKRLDVRMAPSRFLADLAEQNGLGTVEHLPHGVDPTTPPGGERAGLVFIGSLAPHKGPDVVHRAWQAAGEPAPLRIFGPPVDAAYAATLPHHGPLPPDQVQPTLRRARALVVGSVWPENAPLIVLEARAAGCPIVAPDIGGLPELIEIGRDGLLYPPGDVDALARAIKQVLDRSWPDVRAPWDFDAHVDRVQAHYLELLRDRPHRAGDHM